LTTLSRPASSVASWSTAGPTARQGPSPGGPQIDPYGKRRHGGHGVERRIACGNQPRERSVAVGRLPNPALSGYASRGPKKG
jgi:hypothetical protein